MADNKKYYYLKLKEDFFESDEAVVLESMPDGYIYSNILLKLYLRSLKNNGLLMFNNLIPYNSQMLATITRHQVGTIEKAVKIFKDLQLIDVLDNGAIYMTNIQNFVGKSSTEADRIRKLRSKKNTDVQMYTIENNKCTPEIEIDKDIKRDIEINIELEKEQEIEIRSTYKMFEEEYGRLLSSYQSEIVLKLLKENPAELVREALKTSVSSGKTKRGTLNLSYIEGILRNWQLDNVKAVSDIRKPQANSFQTGQGSQQRQTNVPSWSEEPIKTEQTEEGQKKLAEIFAELEELEGTND
ncbi:TPA: phage replisome organizer N-terminal domain-containing protein [Streptococcus suis]|nr:phage replisome organizer N-terminal domain-containing protein [Streptococcus suis]